MPTTPVANELPFHKMKRNRRLPGLRVSHPLPCKLLHRGARERELFHFVGLPEHALHFLRSKTARALRCGFLHPIDRVDVCGLNPLLTTGKTGRKNGCC